MSWKEKYKEHLTPKGELKRTSSTELKTEVFIARARELHGDKYDYSKVKYEGSLSKIIIICPTHGEFEQTANNHLQGKGCQRCSVDRQRGTKENFISRAQEIHSSFYDYSSVNYKSTGTKVDIICPIHGVFNQTPDNHLRGQGCPSCSGNKKKTTEEFISIASATHKNAYTYSSVKYINNSTKVLITCPTHGDFEQTPANHLSGNGCPRCAWKNYNTIYLIEYLCAGTRLGTKVGITSVFDRRFAELKRASPYDMEFVQYWVVEDPKAIESKVLERFTRVDSLGVSFDGSTEILKEPTEQIAQFIEGLVYAAI